MKPTLDGAGSAVIMRQVAETRFGRHPPCGNLTSINRKRRASSRSALGTKSDAVWWAVDRPAWFWHFFWSCRGIPVRLLEAHLDFDRDFRGDTVHPSTLEILDSLGLADQLLSLPHSVVRRLAIKTSQATFAVADFSGLKSKFPFIALIPQVKFLDLLASEAKRLPAFSLTMGANVKELVREEGQIRGVRYQSHEGWGEVRAELTIGCDGRFSRLRELVGATPVKSAPPMDVLWFRLPRLEGDTEPGEAGIRIEPGKLLIRLDRGDEWQVGFIIPKGGYHDLRSRGLPALRQSIAELMPEFAGRLDSLNNWSQIRATRGRIEHRQAMVRARAAVARRCRPCHVAGRRCGNQLCDPGCRGRRQHSRGPAGQRDSRDLTPRRDPTQTILAGPPDAVCPGPDPESDDRQSPRPGAPIPAPGHCEASDLSLDADAAHRLRPGPSQG